MRHPSKNNWGKKVKKDQCSVDKDNHCCGFRENQYE